MRLKSLNHNKAKTIGIATNAVINRCARLLMQHLPKTSFTSLEELDSLQELFLGKVRPERFRYIEFAVGGLPKQIVRKPEFTTRADDEIRIGSTLQIKIFCN